MPQRHDRSFDWKWIIGMVLGGLVTYFTTMSSVQARIGILEERENNHYRELMKGMDELKTLVKEEVPRAIREELRRQRQDPNGGGN